MIYTWFWTCEPMAACHCGYSRCRYPTTYRRAHGWHGDCIFPMWWPDSGTSGESCLIRIGEDVSIWGRFAHQTCNDLFMFIVSSLASAGSCRLHWFQKQVYLVIAIDKYSSLFLASGASAVIMSLHMTFMRYETKLADYSPLLFRNCGIADLTVEYQYATHRYQLFLQHMTDRDNELLF